MRNVMIVAAVVGVLSGCGAMSRDHWVYAKPGATQAQQRQDEQACREQAVGSLEDKVATYGETMNRDAFNECMRGRGYAVSMGSMSLR
jgi:uncharacterized protein YceK